MRLTSATVVLLCGWATLCAQQQGQTSKVPDDPTVTTVEHPYTSPVAPFTVMVPEQWQTELEDGSSEATFHRGRVIVSVSADAVKRDDPVGLYLKTAEILLKESCPTATTIAQGSETIAGAPGTYVVVRCAKSDQGSTDVHMGATYLHERLYTFSTTVATRFLEQAKPVFAAMLASFQSIPDRSQETSAQKQERINAAEAVFAREHAKLKSACEAGHLGVDQCTNRLARLQADRGAAEDGSTVTSGQVIHY